MTMRNLNALAADLTSVGVKYKIVTAAESKDTGAPYSSKRYLKSLDDKRFVYVAAAVVKLDIIATKLTRFGFDAKDMTAKERKQWVDNIIPQLSTLKLILERSEYAVHAISKSHDEAVGRTYDKLFKFDTDTWDGNGSTWIDVIAGINNDKLDIAQDLRKLRKEAIARGINFKDIEEAARFGKFSLVRYEITPKAK